VVGKFEMPGSLLDESPVHQADFAETFERAVNCNFVKVLFAHSQGNLVLAEWFFYCGKYL